MMRQCRPSGHVGVRQDGSLGPKAREWLDSILANRIPKKRGRIALCHLLTPRAACGPSSRSMNGRRGGSISSRPAPLSAMTTTRFTSCARGWLGDTQSDHHAAWRAGAGRS